MGCLGYFEQVDGDKFKEGGRRTAFELIGVISCATDSEGSGIGFGIHGRSKDRGRNRVDAALFLGASSSPGTRGRRDSAVVDGIHGGFRDWIEVHLQVALAFDGVANVQNVEHELQQQT